MKPRPGNVLALLLGFAFWFAARADASLVLLNGTFDDDPDLAGADDTMTPPTHWFTHYTGDQTWSDFRFGNDGNGGWDNNGITFGQNFLGPTFTPGPEDGYFYTRLGTYSGEVSAKVTGFGYNRVKNDAGNFDVSLYFTSPGTFTAANGSDPATLGNQIAYTLVDISSLTGPNPQSLPFTLTGDFAPSGIQAGDEIWLRFSDGPEDGNLATFDEPTVDNLTFTATIPEPTGMAAVAAAMAACARTLARRRRATHPRNGDLALRPPPCP
jgi:hypothetical protein